MMSTAMMTAPGAPNIMVAAAVPTRSDGGELDAAPDHVRRGGRALDRQQAEVGDVGQQVEQDHRRRPDPEAEGDGAPGLDHLAGGEGDVLPGDAREQRADQRGAERAGQGETGERHHRSDHAAGDLRLAGAPEVLEVGGEGRPVRRRGRGRATIRPRTAAVLARVKVFCRSRPPWRPRRLTG